MSEQNRNSKEYLFHPRWKFVLELTTESPLHIGSGEFTDHNDLTVEDEETGEKRLADINECIKDGRGKPFIPGSTIKGKLRQWLEEHLAADSPDRNEAKTLLRGLLGHGKGNGASSEDKELGGSAEFLAATLSDEVSYTEYTAPPYWRPDRQTSVETSIAVDRVTRTAADKKLFYSEVVPPGAGFTLTVVGAMPREQAALLAAALQTGFTTARPVSFGGDTANGGGRMRFNDLQISCLGRVEAANWLIGQDGIMAEAAMRSLPQEEIDGLVAEGSRYLRQSISSPLAVTINLRFAGPFLVNDPSRCLGRIRDGIKDPDHFPLQDRDGNPILPAKSVRGALRSQAEKIIRTLGGCCCDPADPAATCPPVYRAEDKDRLCPACRLFGGTGWKSRVSISRVQFLDARPPTGNTLLHKQDFVAIDRFHGGSRDTAKFDATFFQQPAFTITLELAPDIDEAAKGLLALILRDFEEGDIFLGFGRSKGYGKILSEETEIFGAESLQTEAALAAFREQCRADSNPLPCVAREIPDSVPSSEPLQNSSQNSGQRTGDGQKFHNPYHFVPVKKPNTETWLATKDFVKTKETIHDSHALYREKDDKGNPILHGRISCTLTTETPLFIGGERGEGEPKPIDHFRIDGEPAIPATSLRGMLSSLAEAASNSALRVLDDTMMSCRHWIGEDSLSAIGMVIKKGERYYIYPLTLPIYDNNSEQDSLSAYRAMFPEGKKWSLKVYLENSYRHGAMERFVDTAETWNMRHPQIYYLPAPVAGELKTAGPWVLRRSPAGNPVPTAKRLHETDQPGILRILGKEGRGDNIPSTKKHELFLPVPEEFAADPRGFIEELKQDETRIFVIPPEVVDTFERLADQRTKPQIKHPDGITETQWLPYHPKGCSRNNGQNDIDPHQMRLQEGDLVYFRPFSGSPRQVAEISFSSIWRSRVQKTVHKYFSTSFSPELCPFNKDRKHISPAELLFGFVQQEKGGDQLAFAGKTVFSSARLQEGQGDPFTEKEVTLKILSSPKLPSPALYFDGPGYVAKHSMQGGSIRPQGRKQYLHALGNGEDPQGVQKISQTGERTAAGPYPWESRHGKEFANQKVRIRPLRKGVQFRFTVDFENCTEWELGLLLYALWPSKAYRHKIGMGKPLGLGSVQIDIEGVDLIDRKKRYAEDSLGAARYNDAPQEELESWRTRFADSMEPEIRHALELLGDPAKVLDPVHYPQVQGADIEKETFKWFVANDLGSGKGHNKIEAKKAHLPPLSESEGILPLLERHEWRGE